MTEFREVARFIGSASEAEIRSIHEMCTLRTKTLRTLAATENLATLQTGDVVVLHDVSPKYLNGQFATVITTQAYKAGRVSIKLTEPVGRFSDRPMEVPASCLTKAS